MPKETMKIFYKLNYFRTLELTFPHIFRFWCYAPLTSLEWGNTFFGGIHFLHEEFYFLTHKKCKKKCKKFKIFQKNK